MQSFDHIIVIINPASTNARKSGHKIKELQKLFPATDLHLIETSAAGEQANIEIVRSLKPMLGSKTLLCIAAGDGTTNSILETLLTDPALSGKARKTPILPLWGGNANDLAYMLNGLASRTSLQQVFEKGEIVAVHPLELRFSPTSGRKAERTSRLAMCYASFGASAYAAQQINKPAHRKKRLHTIPGFKTIAELIAVITAYINAPVFRIAQGGKSVLLYEYVMINGSRIAKVDRVPLKLTDKAYYHAAVHRKHPRIILYILRLIRRQSYGTVTDSKQSFVTEQDMFGQFDGESMRIAAGTRVDVRISKRPFYALSSKLAPPSTQPADAKKAGRRWHFGRRPVLILGSLALLGLFALFHAYLHITNPFAKWNIVKNPYTTQIEDGQITYTQNYQTRVLTGSFWSLFGYYKSGFLIVQNKFFGSQKAKADKADDIINEIHRLRFDPAKPYMISGDQFSVLYSRNLGVFYNSLLNPNTATDQADWQNRQRVYLQSVLYGIDGLANGGPVRTTLVPVGPRHVAATQVHPGSVTSDSVYGLLFALDRLKTPAYTYPDGFQLQTVGSADRILTDKKAALQALVTQYKKEVQDPQTGMVKKDLKLAGARDGVTRDRSFFDNIVLWKTLRLANDLGIVATDTTELDRLRDDILTAYWDEEAGHFKDSLTTRPGSQNYGSDWLLAMPTGLLDARNSDDFHKIERTIAYIRDKRLAEPLPIKYQAESTAEEAPWAVRTFVPDYGASAIWSYWGAEYIKLLAQAYHVSGDQSYKQEAERHIATYRQKIEQYRGFPESFDDKGNFLQNAVYKSIRQTGWVVAYEDAVVTLADGSR